MSSNVSNGVNVKKLKTCILTVTKYCHVINPSPDSMPSGCLTTHVLSLDLHRSRAPGTEQPGLWPPHHREPPGPCQAGHPRAAQAMEGRARARLAHPRAAGEAALCAPWGLPRAAGGAHTRAPWGCSRAAGGLTLARATGGLALAAGATSPRRRGQPAYGRRHLVNEEID
jgi:hypothetical protein